MGLEDGLGSQTVGTSSFRSSSGLVARDLGSAGRLRIADGGIGAATLEAVGTDVPSSLACSTGARRDRTGCRANLDIANGRVRAAANEAVAAAEERAQTGSAGAVVPEALGAGADGRGTCNVNTAREAAAALQSGGEVELARAEGGGALGESGDGVGEGDEGRGNRDGSNEMHLEADWERDKEILGAIGVRVDYIVDIAGCAAHHASVTLRAFSPFTAASWTLAIFEALSGEAAEKDHSSFVDDPSDMPSNDYGLQLKDSASAILVGGVVKELRRCCLDALVAGVQSDWDGPPNAANDEEAWKNLR
ncbi:hypothetical protein OPT61_g9670 [Boeremia exigua]|uniref:Uncharacterized protein n=1 Tax=Boeremia exigua TaxID=749465 RepID=A0ACC2HT28_9PLEO|nr:hypothetical protein OPT61_g9670 [Boeremia exigua]